MLHKRLFWTRLMAGTFLCGIAGNAAFAQTAANINAANLLSNFSQLNSSAAGRAVLSENLATSIGINNNSSSALRSQAVVDNTLGALIGSLSNGIVVSNGLGPALNAVFLTRNSVAQNYTFTALSSNFSALMSQIDTLTVGGDSAFTKNFYANGSVNGKATSPASGISLPAGGIFNTYDVAYSPAAGNANTVGDSRPYEVDPAQIETFTANDYFGVSTNSQTGILSTLGSNASFPSGHSAAGFTESTLLAMMVPERYQALVLRGAQFANSRIVLGAHYTLDVIGARIQTYYGLVQALNNNPDYLGKTVPGLLGGTITTTNNFETLFTSAQTDLRTLLDTCTGGIAACAATTAATDPLAYSKANLAAFTYMLTYGLSPTGPTNLDPVVPVGANVLIATRFPYLTAAQQDAVLASTEIASGQALDNGSGYARLNLYAAAGGYGSFDGLVDVTMDAAQGGFNALDTWTNDIGDYVPPSTGVPVQGSLTKEGTGTLVLAGNDSYTGTTTVKGGALVFTGTSRLTGAFINDAILSTALPNGTADGNLTIGTYTGGPGSQIILGTSGSGAEINITGGITPGSTTELVLANTSTRAATYDPKGKVLINLPAGAQAAASDFTLAGGSANAGLFGYNLVYNPDPQFILVSLPDADAYRLATIGSATQSIWTDTTNAIADRQRELRDDLAQNTAGATGGAPAGAPVGAAWFRALGDWSSRSETQHVASYGSTISNNVGYDLTTSGVVGGIDGGATSVLRPGDTVLFGISGGYSGSSQNFSHASSHANYSGVSLGVTASYLKAGFFLDTIFNADLLYMKVRLPQLAAYGASAGTGGAYTYGVNTDAGYQFHLLPAVNLEPVATLAYNRSKIDSLTFAGTDVDFNHENILRGRVGLRSAAALMQDTHYRVSVSGAASGWFRLSGKSSATLDDATGASAVTLNDQQVKNYGEIGLSANYLNLDQNWSVYTTASYKFSSGYKAASLVGGLHYSF